jgi:phage baseplate assembly protein W
MATIHPLDLNPNKGIGLKYPLSADSKNTFALNYTTKDQIKTNLLNFILTNEGERIMMPPDYGFGANKLLFETDTDVEIGLRDRLSAKIEKWMPYVRIQSVELNTNPNNPQEINAQIIFVTDLDPVSPDTLLLVLAIE